MKTTIIAEAGVNHNGILENAFKLVDAAADAGADFIKFQTFKTENLVSKTARKAIYQKTNAGNPDETQFQMLKKLELSAEDHERLVGYCQSKNIHFFSTGFDLDSLQFLQDIGLMMVKIPSGEITNLPYLRKASSLFQEVILSTGMANMAEIRDALNIFLKAKIPKEKITILHCNTEYPTPMKDVNLKAMLHIGDSFGTPIGYSDHTMGIEVPIAAVSLGASLIEKHFTLSRTMEGPDHKASLEPHELKAMVQAIRNVELALSGNGLKEPSLSELKNKIVARKSIVAKQSITKGEILSENNITTKRPGNGLSPMKWDDVLGKKAIRDFKEDEPIEI